MSDPFLGEIRIFAGNFPPAGWEFCAGQLVGIAENDALYALIGTIYGGDGIMTFGLPDLRGRSAVHAGTMPADGRTYMMGDKYGVEQVVVTAPQMPAHTHVPRTAQTADGTGPGQKSWATQAPFAYAPAAGTVQMASDAVLPAGGSTPHENMPPFVAVSFIICVNGIFPPRD